MKTLRILKIRLTDNLYAVLDHASIILSQRALRTAGAIMQWKLAGGSLTPQFDGILKSFH
jgi:hypothetical protein